MKKGVTVRFANADDTELFAKWVNENTDITEADKKVLKYPTTITMVIEEDGHPILFMPLALSFLISFLAFKPSLQAREAVEAVQAALEGLTNLGNSTGVCEVYVFPKPQCPLKKWTLQNNFNECASAFNLNLFQKGEPTR